MSATLRVPEAPSQSRASSKAGVGPKKVMREEVVGRPRLRDAERVAVLAEMKACLPHAPRGVGARDEIREWL